MQKRFMAIWFRYLTTDRLTLCRPELKGRPLVLATAERGRKVITAVNAEAQKQGIAAGTPVADARAMISGLEVFDEQPGHALKLLNALAGWSIRYTPFVTIDPPDGLILDISGCAHLWGGEHGYLKEIVNRLRNSGYHTHAAIADTAGTAWAISRYGKASSVIESKGQAQALLSLPPAALRLEPGVLERLHKLGMNQIKRFMDMPRSVLRRRFGNDLILRLGQALGTEDEPLFPLQPAEPYLERLPCLEPIRTAAGIEIAIQKLLHTLCRRLQQEGMGLRTAVLKCYRIDGETVQAEIGTNCASRHTEHLFKLFQHRIPSIEPALGIELFTLEAPKVEEVSRTQEALWSKNPGLNAADVTELLDRVAMRVGREAICRYLPDEHYWPERSFKVSVSVTEKPSAEWRTDRPRPVVLLKKPVRIEVTAPIPDYPPMLFIYKGRRHIIKKADGPERIEREWWLDTGEHRDYYQAEDEEGKRYWIFRSGHYSGEKDNQWFIHGFFA